MVGDRQTEITSNLGAECWVEEHAGCYGNVKSGHLIISLGAQRNLEDVPSKLGLQ